MKIRSLQELVDRANQMGGTLGAAAMALQVEQDRDDPIQMREKMRQALEVMRQSVESGMDPHTHSVSGLTGGQAARLMAVAESGASVGGTDLTRAAARALAVAEFNAAMGRIVAAPTAGASGVLPGVFFSLKKHCQLSDDTLARGLVVAGSIGMVIAERASLAGATGGCQAECGSAAAMAAGAAVSMLGGSAEQVGTAVAIVFKNVLGLVCDPVAGLVEVPCIKRNGACALQALLAAQLALSGIGSFINADEAIDAMKSVGDSLPCALKETAGGGMATTPSALAWAKEYFAKAHK